MQTIIKKVSLLLTLNIILPLTALAQPNTLGKPITQPETVLAYIKTIGNWIFSLLLALAVIYILLAAYNYLTGSTGEGVGKAHKMILWAAVAITVAVFAKGIVYVITALAGSPIEPNSI